MILYNGKLFSNVFFCSGSFNHLLKVVYVSATSAGKRLIRRNLTYRFTGCGEILSNSLQTDSPTAEGEEMIILL